MDYPNDADGDALRRVAEDGNDMSQPMDIDFAVAVPDEESGRMVAEAAVERGYSVNLDYDDEVDAWTCYCNKSVVPCYDALVAAQEELDELSRPFGGHSDGWGTFGNKDG